MIQQLVNDAAAAIVVVVALLLLVMVMVVMHGGVHAYLSVSIVCGFFALAVSLHVHFDWLCCCLALLFSLFASWIFLLDCFSYWWLCFFDVSPPLATVFVCFMWRALLGDEQTCSTMLCYATGRNNIVIESQFIVWVRCKQATSHQIKIQGEESLQPHLHPSARFAQH